MTFSNKLKSFQNHRLILFYSKNKLYHIILKYAIINIRTNHNLLWKSFSFLLSSCWLLLPDSSSSSSKMETCKLEKLNMVSNDLTLTFKNIKTLNFLKHLNFSYFTIALKYSIRRNIYGSWCNLSSWKFQLRFLWGFILIGITFSFYVCIKMIELIMTF